MNENCQTKGSLFTKIAFCTFLHISGFLPLFSPSLFSFPSFCPLLFSVWPLFFHGFFSVSFSYLPTHLKFNGQLSSFVIQRGCCAVYFLFARVSSLLYYQLEPDIHRHYILTIWRVPRFSSVLQSCPTLCDPMNCSMPGLPVHHQLPEFTQTHVHRVGDAIQPSYPLLSPSPPVPNPSQHQGLFQ